ncbi:PulJ/GspJ family protein [Ulvibacterium marinum]|uniref:PulJ/GspJ family protein n=1 Tax=Ulvibacterium marinum TaxID=2419782 RepID=UPI0024958F6F|nr:prepilin-type N-terminal cleavage/methylation domain-containing protein [Ulvibacterium marinum]
MQIRLKKIRAFTLSEMIVVLLITTMVVGMAFSVLRLVQNQMNGITGNYERNTEFNLLRQSLWIDFNKHDRIYYNENNRELQFVNEMGGQTYRFEEDFITKDIDTFRIKWEARRFLFENRDISLGEIDAIHFQTTKASGNRSLFVYKNNSATTYMNQ